VGEVGDTHLIAQRRSPEQQSDGINRPRVRPAGDVSLKAHLEITMSRKWVARFHHCKFFVQHRDSRTRYQADDRLHAVRIARCLNQGAELFGAKKLMMAMLRDLSGRT
jgi:hypothetical protein